MAVTNLESVKITVNVGHYRLDQFCFMLSKKPNWFHRTMMKLFFGFQWEDKETK